MIYWIDVTDGNIFTLINRGTFLKNTSYINEDCFYTLNIFSGEIMGFLWESNSHLKPLQIVRKR